VVETLKTPYLLVASPTLLDPNFASTVVLMGHHTTDGALGWVVNRVLDEPAAELLEPPLDTLVHPETPLRIGGPVATDGLIVVHREPQPVDGSREIAPGLHLASSASILPLLFGEAPREPPLGLLIHGYAGWGPSQLETEMKDAAWLVVPYAVDLAFATEVDGLWERALARLGVRPGSVTAAPSRPS
jgi:putative transcriptional regulator